MTAQPKATSCYSRMWTTEINEAILLSVVTGLAACLNATGAPHEYFDHSGMN
jgi:hypothetical protein